MYNKAKKGSTTNIKINGSVQGESIEEKMRRILENKEPITDGAPLEYTEKSDGVKAGYNIRTDRWEIALDGIDSIQKSENAKRESKMEIVKDDKKEEIGKTEPIDGTEGTQSESK